MTRCFQSEEAGSLNTKRESHFLIVWEWGVYEFVVVGAGELFRYICRITYSEVCMMGFRRVFIIYL